MKNKEVYDWYVPSQSSHSGKQILELFQEKFDIVVNCETCSLLTKIKRLVENVKDTRRKRNIMKLNDLFAKEFILPSNENILRNTDPSERELKLVETVKALKSDNRSLKRRLDSLDELEEKYAVVFSTMSEISDGLKDAILQKRNVEDELKKAKLLYKKKEDHLARIEQQFMEMKLKASSSNVRNLNKKVKYRDQQLERKNEKICEEKEKNNLIVKELNLKIRSLEKYIEKQDSCVKGMSDEKIQLQKKISYLKKSVEAKNKYIKNFDMKDIETLEKEIKDITESSENLRKENCELEQLVALLQDDEIVSFEGGRYSDDVRETIMQLLSLNVSMNKVNDVIKVVLNKLAKKDISKLPSAGVKSRLMQEALIISQIQVAEAILSNDQNVGNCLHGDGTSKYHKHYQNFQVTTASGKTLSFGLSEIAGGDAASVLKSFTNTIDDLCDVMLSGKKDTNFAKLITSIKTTMSDLGPINPLFNAQLKSLREELLPTAIENWNVLEDDDKSEIKDMANFFCKLHLLANFATETDKVLNAFEKILLSDSFEQVFAFNTKESGATRLVRTACKAFHVCGSDEAGVASYFNSFLESQGLKSQFAPFVGNRFNILFFNAAALYYHKEQVIHFLNAWPAPNNLLKAVQEDITNKVFFAEVRAMGIIDKLLTGPLWRLIEEKKSILEVNPYLFRLKLKLSDLCKDSAPLLEGTPIFNDVDIHDDEVFQKLFTDTNDNEFNILTQQALEVICHAILLILERQCTDQLPGGKYWNPTDSIIRSSAVVPVTNKASESDFAILDLLVRTKPNASVQTLQALTMWSRNHTLEWLNEKNDTDRVALLENARKNVNVMKAKYASRNNELMKLKEEKLRKKQQMKRESEEKSAAKKVEAVNDLILLKVKAWLTIDEAESEIMKIDEIDRRNVLIAQLDFYRYVMEISCKAKLFSKTKSENGKRISIPWEELFENLKLVIHAVKLPPTYSIKKTPLKSQDVRDKVVFEQKNELMGKIKNARLAKVMK